MEDHDGTLFDVELKLYIQGQDGLEQSTSLQLLSNVAFTRMTPSNIFGIGSEVWLPLLKRVNLATHPTLASILELLDMQWRSARGC